MSEHVLPRQKGVMLFMNGPELLSQNLFISVTPPASYGVPLESKNTVVAY